MRYTFNLRPFGKLAGASAPNVAQLPVEAVVGERQQSLVGAIRIMREKSRIFAAQVHVAEQADASGVGFERLLGSDAVSRSSRRDLEPIIRDNFVSHSFMHRLFGESQPDRNLVGLLLSRRHIMNL